MRSVDRCKSTFQGDRCKRERDHENTSKDNPQVHTGEFTMWTGEQVLFQKRGTHLRKRSRAANRTVREISSLNLNETKPEVRAAIKEYLGKIEKFFGGKIDPRRVLGDVPVADREDGSYHNREER